MPRNKQTKKQSFSFFDSSQQDVPTQNTYNKPNQISQNRMQQIGDRGSIDCQAKTSKASKKQQTSKHIVNEQNRQEKIMQIQLKPKQKNPGIKIEQFQHLWKRMQFFEESQSLAQVPVLKVQDQRTEQDKKDCDLKPSKLLRCWTYKRKLTYQHLKKLKETLDLLSKSNKTKVQKKRSLINLANQIKISFSVIEKVHKQYTYDPNLTNRFKKIPRKGFTMTAPVKQKLKVIKDPYEESQLNEVINY